VDINRFVLSVCILNFLILLALLHRPTFSRPGEVSGEPSFSLAAEPCDNTSIPSYQFFNNNFEYIILSFEPAIAH
jgi:hypothetical protein